MDSAFKSAKEKLEREHRESKERAKPKLEQERKVKDAARTQRQAIEASQRAKRIEAIEASQRAKRIEAIVAQMKAKVKRKEVDKSKGGSLTDRMKALHLPNSDEEEKEDVKSETKRRKRSYQVGDSSHQAPPMKALPLPNSDEEADAKSKGGFLTKRKKTSYLTSPPWYLYLPRMRQEAKTEACYAYIRKNQEVAEKPNQQESAGELTPELQTAATTYEEEEAPVAANGSCKRWTAMWKQKKKKSEEEDDWV